MKKVFAVIAAIALLGIVSLSMSLPSRADDVSAWGGHYVGTALRASTGAPASIVTLDVTSTGRLTGSISPIVASGSVFTADGKISCVVDGPRAVTKAFPLEGGTFNADGSFTATCHGQSVSGTLTQEKSGKYLVNFAGGPCELVRK